MRVLRMIRKFTVRAGMMLLLAVLSGCVSAYNVGMAGKTPVSMGNVKLYSTDSVPFEYEELGFVSVRVDGSPFGPPTQDYALGIFQREVAKTGADAVLNFRVEEAFWSSWLFFPGGSCARVFGTGVRIVRP